MKIFRTLAGLLVTGALLLAAGLVIAQTATLPIPSGVATTGQLLVATDNNNVQGSSSLTLGSGTAITQMLVATATITSVSIAANKCTQQAYAVSGLTTADKVFVNPTFTMGAEGFIASANVPAAGSLELVLCNPNTSQADPETGTVNVLAIRS